MVEHVSNPQILEVEAHGLLEIHKQKAAKTSMSHQLGANHENVITVLGKGEGWKQSKKHALAEQAAAMSCTCPAGFFPGKFISSTI